MNKVLKIVFLVIIPLLVAFGIGAYGYKRYKDYFVVEDQKHGYYDVNTQEGDSLSKVEAYLKLNTVYYEKIANEEVKNAAGEKLFAYALYRTIAEESSEGNENSQVMKYSFVSYDIDYGKIYKEIYPANLYPGDNHKFKYLPTVAIEIINHATAGSDEEVSKRIQMTSSSLYDFIDYNWVGFTKEDGTKTKEYYDGTEISATYYNGTGRVKWSTFDVNEEYSSDIDVRVFVTDSQYPSDEAATIKVATYSYNNMIQNVESFNENAENVVKGYNGNIQAAGYAKFAIGTYIWWECLIAIILTLFVTGATVLVWDADRLLEKWKNK